MNANIKNRQDWETALALLRAGKDRIGSTRTADLIREVFKDPADAAAALQLFLTFVYQEEVATTIDVLLEITDAFLTHYPACIWFSSIVLLMVYQKWQPATQVNVINEIKTAGEQAAFFEKPAESDRFLNFSDWLAKHANFWAPHPCYG